MILSIPLGALKTGAKAQEQIYDLVDQLFNLGRVGDTVTTDGTEQTIFIVDNPDFSFKPIKFVIDFTNNTATEDVTIKTYYRIKEGGNYIKETELNISGVVDPLLNTLDLIPSTFGVKITIEKTAGTNRAYDWECYFEEK